MNAAQQPAANGHAAPVAIDPKWGLLFGLTPPEIPGKKRPVPHDLFGLHGRTGSDAERTAARDRRRRHVLEYLREHGPQNTRMLADAFGVSVQTIGADLKALAEQGLAEGSYAKFRPTWRAI